jgi:hypothetical protein
MIDELSMLRQARSIATHAERLRLAADIFLAAKTTERADMMMVAGREMWEELMRYFDGVGR